MRDTHSHAFLGSTCVPAEGFAGLVGLNGVVGFCIGLKYGSHTALPTASTCFNLLKLPRYETRDECHKKV